MADPEKKTKHALVVSGSELVDNRMALRNITDWAGPVDQNLALLKEGVDDTLSEVERVKKCLKLAFIHPRVDYKPAGSTQLVIGTKFLLFLGLAMVVVLLLAWAGWHVSRHYRLFY